MVQEATGRTPAGASTGQVVAVPRAEREGVETERLEWDTPDDWQTTAQAAGGQWAGRQPRGQTVAANLFTKDWNARFDMLHLTRKLIKFQPGAIDQFMCVRSVGRLSSCGGASAELGHCLQECLKNPQSSIQHEACMLAGAVGLD